MENKTETTLNTLNMLINTVAQQIANEEMTLEQAAAETGWPIEDGVLIPAPDVWHADDGNAEVVYDGVTDAQGRYVGNGPKVASGEDAANEYATTGYSGYDWDDEDKSSFWVDVWAWRTGIDQDGDIVRVNRDKHTITIDPDEPKCTEDEHDWDSPYELLGGIEENPGVWGHGGGVVIHEVCMHCGCERITDTWAQDPNNGRQGLRSVKYDPGKYADEVEAIRMHE